MFIKVAVIIFVSALSLTIPLPANTQRSRDQKAAGYWEGKITVEKAYKDTVGEYRWTGEYRVLLAEKARRKISYYDDPTRNVTASHLDPIELDYEIKANQMLNEACFKEPNEEIVQGRASGRLRVNQANRRNNVVWTGDNPVDSQKRVVGVVFHDADEPRVLWVVEKRKKLSYDRDDLEYWKACEFRGARDSGQIAKPNSYTISINLLTNTNGSDAWTIDETLSLFEGISSTGERLKQRTQGYPLAFLQTAAMEVVKFHICGQFKPDDEVISGSHTFSDRIGLSDNWSCSVANEPKILKIRWELRRRKTGAGDDASSTTTTGGSSAGRRDSAGTLPADLKVAVRAVPTLVSGARRVQYIIVIGNNGPGSAISATLTNVLPAKATFVSATPGKCAPDAGTVICKLGDIKKAASSTIVIVAAFAKPGAQENQATVTSAVPDPNATNNRVVTTTTIR